MALFSSMFASFVHSKRHLLRRNQVKNVCKLIALFANYNSKQPSNLL